MWISQNTKYDVFEMDELYWFTNKKSRLKTHENMYIIALISRFPRQIVGYDVDKTKMAHQMQSIVDSTAPAKFYCTDGNLTYIDVDFPSKHIRNTRDKNDTHNVESVNADLRHYIPGLARRSRCFYRSLETLKAVLEVFVEAYNKYGEAKEKCRTLTKHISKAKHLHKYRELPFSVLDFI